MLMVLCLNACSPGDIGKSMPIVNETHVLSVFKMVETVQGVRMTDRDGLARTLAALKSEGYATAQLDAIVAAQAQGVAFQGYLFRDLMGDTSGLRYGLVAVPEKSGSGASFLLLIDLRNIQVNEETGTSNGMGAELYKSTTASLRGDEWPTPTELANWSKISRRSPKEALEAAKELKAKHDAAR
jgi:hypothetical protein